jgi:hypothetical protein
MVQLMNTSDDLPRKLTAHERALIEQAKEDFRGRTVVLARRSPRPE